MNFVCGFLVTVVSIGATADEGVHYEGRIFLDSITVVNGDKVTTYKIREDARDFHLWPQGPLQVGMTTRCPPFIGELQKELVIEAEVTARYKEGGFDKDLRPARTSVGSVGKAKIIAPAGTRAWGTCAGKEVPTLVELTLDNGGDDPIRVVMQGEERPSF